MFLSFTAKFTVLSHSLWDQAQSTRRDLELTLPIQTTTGAVILCLMSWVFQMRWALRPNHSRPNHSMRILWFHPAELDTALPHSKWVNVTQQVPSWGEEHSSVCTFSYSCLEGRHIWNLWHFFLFELCKVLAPVLLPPLVQRLGKAQKLVLASSWDAVICSRKTPRADLDLSSHCRKFYQRPNWFRRASGLQDTRMIPEHGKVLKSPQTFWSAPEPFIIEQEGSHAKWDMHLVYHQLKAGGYKSHLERQEQSKACWMHPWGTLVPSGKLAMLQQYI